MKVHLSEGADRKYGLDSWKAGLGHGGPANLAGMRDPLLREVVWWNHNVTHRRTVLRPEFD